MSERHARLGYAAPDRVKRPPMYSLVIVVLASTCLIVLGLGLCYAVGFGFWLRFRYGDTEVKVWQLWLSLPLLAFGIVFLIAGALSMAGTIQSLRGVSSRGKRWERW